MKFQTKIRRIQACGRYSLALKKHKAERNGKL